MSDRVHRVFRMQKTLKIAVRDARERRQEKLIDFVAHAVTNQLPTLVQSLQGLGFAKQGKKTPARLPFDPSTLATLRAASQQTTVPASSLLLLCLSAASAPGAATSPAPAPKAKETQRKATEKAPRRKARKLTLDEIKGIVDKNMGVPRKARKTEAK